MAKVKNKAKPAGKADASPGQAETRPPKTITFADFQTQVAALQRAGDAQGVLALVSETDTSIITEVPSQLYLPLWLARLKVQALVPEREPGRRRWVTGDVVHLLEPLLDQIAAMDDTFCASPEFDIFLQIHSHGPKAALLKYHWLLKACREMPDRLDLLDKLRGAVFTLLDQDGWEEDKQVDADEVARLGDIGGVLAEFIDVALEGVVLEEDRIRLTLYRLDLELRTAEPWDYPSIAARVRQLGSPAADEVGTLTPDSWAFAWELRYLAAEGFGELVKAYAPEKLSRSARGLYHVLRSVSESGPDATFIQGLTLLADARERGDSDTMGGDILLLTGAGFQHLPIGWVDLEVPTPAQLLVHVTEVVPTEHPYASRLLAAAIAWSAGERYDKISEEAAGLLSQEALDWLTTHVPGFALQLAYVHPDGAVRLLVVLRELLQRARANSAERFDVEADVDDAQPTRKQRQEIRELLSQMAVYSGGMSEKLEREWRRVVGHALRALTRGADPSELVEALEVGRALEGDLAAAHEFGILAYLEHVAGDPAEAVRLYGEVLRNEAADPAWAVGNVKALANGAKNLDTAAVVLEAVEELDLPPTRATQTRDMVAAARARLNKLTEHDQFERTAVARWPSLTAPARKLLAVLSALNSYKSMAELAQYANMDVDWVVRHHRKLVETGMVFDENGKFWINRHIQPLIDRENQHAVIGRIIRTGGTSAVKQVFNSGREFSIYQVMVQLCPNHLVFPNCGLQSFMQYERMKELVEQDDFGYYLRASVDILLVSSTTFLPMLAIEVDSPWHDTEHQQTRDDRKDRLFAVAGVPFLRLRPVGSPSENVIRGQVAEHLQELVRVMRPDLPGYEQTKELLTDLSRVTAAAAGGPGSALPP